MSDKAPTVEGEPADAAAQADFDRVVARVRREGLVDEVASLEPHISRVADPELKAELARLVGFYHLRRGSSGSRRAATGRPWRKR